MRILRSQSNPGDLRIEIDGYADLDALTALFSDINRNSEAGANVARYGNTIDSIVCDVGKGDEDVWVGKLWYEEPADGLKVYIGRDHGFNNAWRWTVFVRLTKAYRVVFQNQWETTRKTWKRLDARAWTIRALKAALEGQAEVRENPSTREFINQGLGALEKTPGGRSADPEGELRDYPWIAATAWRPPKAAQETADLGLALRAYNSVMVSESNLRRRL